MPTSDYLPTKESDLIPWTENFIAVALLILQQLE
jgi:hypothetical protein